MKKYFYILIVSLIIGGCSTTRYIDKTETVITDKVIVPPVIKDTVYVTYTDSVMIQGEKIVKIDTVIKVQYYPKLKKFYINVKPDTITLRDTLQIIKTTVITKEASWLQTNGIYIILALFLTVIIFVLIRFKQ